jgi:hypothetical protein
MRYQADTRPRAVRRKADAPTVRAAGLVKLQGRDAAPSVGLGRFQLGIGGLVSELRSSSSSRSNRPVRSWTSTSACSSWPHSFCVKASIAADKLRLVAANSSDIALSTMRLASRFNFTSAMEKRRARGLVASATLCVRPGTVMQRRPTVGASALRQGKAVDRGPHKASQILKRRAFSRKQSRRA